MNNPLPMPSLLEPMPNHRVNRIPVGQGRAQRFEHDGRDALATHEAVGVAVPESDEGAGAAAGELVAGLSRVLDRLPGAFQQQPLLGVHRLGLAG